MLKSINNYGLCVQNSTAANSLSNQQSRIFQTMFEKTLTWIVMTVFYIILHGRKYSVFSTDKPVIKSYKARHVVITPDFSSKKHRQTGSNPLAVNSCAQHMTFSMCKIRDCRYAEQTNYLFPCKSA